MCTKTRTLKERTCAALLLVWLLAGGRLHAQSVRPGWGSTPYADSRGTGTTFRVWAPLATSVTVAGSWASSQWSPTALPLIAEDGTKGLWSRDVPHARPGDAYKYVLNGQWKADPRGLASDQSGFGNTRIVDRATFNPAAAFTPPPLSAMVIYELHVGTYFDPDPTDTQPATFTDVTAKLDTLSDLGINTIELMPVAEFPGAHSWGYNPALPLAVEETYGGPEGLRAFTEACHARGIAVLVDLVHNHWDPAVLGQWSGPGDGPVTNGCYFYPDHDRAATPWGPRPHFDDAAVTDYMLATVDWYADLGVDGFRLDAVDTMLSTSSGTPIPAGLELVRRLGERVRARGGIWIAENAAAEAGGFDAEWDYAFRGTLASELAKPDAAISRTALAAALRRTSPASILFVENHDTCGLLNSWARRWPLQISSTAPEATRTRKLAMLGAALPMLCPGTPMLFQEQERYAVALFHDDRPADWSRAEREAGMVAFHRDAVRLRRGLDGIGVALQGTGIVTRVTGCGVAIERSDAHEPNLLVALANLTGNAVEESYRFPATGYWYCVLNSDDSRYGFAGAGAAVLNAPPSPTPVLMPPYSLRVFARMAPPAGDVDGDGLPNGWEAAFFGSAHGADAGEDLDGDGLTNLAEYGADTNPRDPLSVLRITALHVDGPRVLLHWSGGGSNAGVAVEQRVATGTWSTVTTSPSNPLILDRHLPEVGFRLRVVR